MKMTKKRLAFFLLHLLFSAVAPIVLVIVRYTSSVKFFFSILFVNARTISVIMPPLPSAARANAKERAEYKALFAAFDTLQAEYDSYKAATAKAEEERAAQLSELIKALASVFERFFRNRRNVDIQRFTRQLFGDTLTERIYVVCTVKQRKILF